MWHILVAIIIYICYILSAKSWQRFWVSGLRSAVVFFGNVVTFSDTFWKTLERQLGKPVWGVESRKQSFRWAVFSSHCHGVEAAMALLEMVQAQNSILFQIPFQESNLPCPLIKRLFLTLSLCLLSGDEPWDFLSSKWWINWNDVLRMDLYQAYFFDLLAVYNNFSWIVFFFQSLMHNFWGSRYELLRKSLGARPG